MSAEQSASPLTVLRHRAFATFWTAAVVSDIGTWMQSITVGVLVAHQTGKATATGLIGVAAFATQGIGAPIGGVLADRFDRRTMMMSALTMQLVVTFALAGTLAGSKPSVGLLTGLVALQSLAGSFGQPAGQALMPSLVPREELLKAVSLGAVSWNAGRIVGSALAALLGVWLSPAWIITLNGLSFAVLIVAVGSVRGTFRAPQVGERGSFVRQLRIGARTLWDTPGCRFAVIAMVFLQTTLISWVGLIPIVAQERLHGGRGLASTITILQGVGALIGASIAAVLVGAIGRPRTMVFFGSLGALALLGYSQATSAWAAYPFVVLLGMASLSLFVCLGAIVQRDAPEHARARITSIQSAVLGTGYGVGVFGSGRLADHFGLGPVLAGNALVWGFVLLVAVGPLRRHWAAVGDGDPRSRRWERVLAERAADARAAP
jgi:MFS family permease